MKRTSCLISLLLLASCLSAQYEFFPYFGKNKVMENTFAWKFRESKHFTLYYYIEDAELVQRLLGSAEAEYDRIAEFLNVQISAKVPILYYNSHTDFEQTNIFPGFMPIGVEAFAEPIAFRVVIQGDRPESEILRTLTHELGHIFEYQILYRDIGGRMFDVNEPPLWVMEGFAEFGTGRWDEFSLMTVRDAVLGDRVPELDERGELVTADTSARAPYDFGHAAFDFIYQKYGRRGIRDLLISQRRASFLSKRAPFLEGLQTTRKQFNFELKKYLRERFKDYTGRENPEEYSYIIGPDFPFAYSFSHQVSPTGELVAVVTANYRSRKIDIVLISVRDGKVVRSITPGFSSLYDEITVRFNPVEGPTFTWDKEGDRIAFFARKEYATYLVVVDVLTAKVVDQVRLAGLQDPSAPVVHPSNHQIYFTARQGLKSSLYAYDPQGKALRQIATGDRYIRAFTFSPAGERIVFSALEGERHRLFLAPTEAIAQATPLATGAGDAITPTFSLDGKRVLFAGGDRGATNICELDMSSGAVSRLSDVRTGLYFPAEIPGQPGKLIVSAFHQGSFFLFSLDTGSRTRVAVATAEPAAKAEAVSPAALKAVLPEGISITDEKRYRPFSKLVLESTPPVTAGMSSRGTLFGYTTLNFADLMGDHSFFLYLASMYGYRNVHFVYSNLKHRTQWYLHLYSNSEAYYYNYYDLEDYYTVRKNYGVDAGLIFPFSRSTRLEVGLGLYKQKEDSDLLYYGVELPYGQFFNGWAVPFRLSLTGETTRFADWGPLMGSTFRLTVSQYVPISSSWMKATVLEGDLRKYIRLDPNTLIALRGQFYYSGGRNRMIYWTGGNNTIRSADFYNMNGERAFVLNAEFRFPLVHAALTPLGLIGPVRGVIFADLGGAWFKGQDFTFFAKGEGLRLKDPVSSYGFGIQFFMLGLPMHVEWVHQTDLKTSSYSGVKFWIGYDF